MAKFISAIKSLSIGNNSVIANFHNGVFITQNDKAIKMLRIAMKRPHLHITEIEEKKEAVTEAKKEAVTEAKKEVAEAVNEELKAEETSEKPKKKASKK